MKFNLAILTGVLAATSGLAIEIDLYDQSNGSGGHDKMNVSPGACVNLRTNFRNKMSSFSKDANRQCRFYDGNNCSGQSRVFPAGRALFCSVDSFTNRANSVRCS